MTDAETKVYIEKQFREILEKPEAIIRVYEAPNAEAWVVIVDDTAWVALADDEFCFWGPNNEGCVTFPYV
jgi:hypothetical protein